MVNSEIEFDEEDDMPDYIQNLEEMDAEDEN